MPMYLPPSMIPGMNQQTTATQMLAAMMTGRPAGTRRRSPTRPRRVRAAAARRPATRKARAARPATRKARLVRGSAAARRHMAKLRRMRRR